MAEWTYVACLLPVFVGVVLNGVTCMPEQGVRILEWIPAFQQCGINCYAAAVGKSMFHSSVLAADIRCENSDGEQIKDKEVTVQWFMKSTRCAQEFQVYDLDDKEVVDPMVEAINQSRFNALGYYTENMEYYYLYFKAQKVKCGDPGVLPDYTNKKWEHVTEPTEKEQSESDSDKKDSAESKPIVTVKSSQRKKREAITSKNESLSSSSASVNESAWFAKVPGAFVQVPVDGMYIFIMIVNSESKMNVSVTVKGVSRFGYLSAIDFPLLPFYAVMVAVYTVFLLAWLFLCCFYRKDILRIQLWIGAVILIGFIDEASFLGEYHTINTTGQSVPGAVIFGELVWSAKRSLSRMVVIIACVGYGIVRPRLGQTLPRVIAVGILYFIPSTIDSYLRAITHRANQQTKRELILIMVLAVTDAGICWWIFTALVQTMRTLRLRRNVVKLSLYRHFTNTLIFSIIASVAFMIWSIVKHKNKACLTDWQELWVEDAFWQLLFTLILLVMMILWRPSANNQRYAYSPLSDGADEDAEEPMMNDAFEGVKMRGSKDSGSSQKHTSDQIEDDLKWIEDNIPSSVADSALPSLLDSEEEIMNTKYELSKMQ